ncbi:MAG TPA: DUF1493 family protein [Scandinavium sp.]|jgi:hypothetical protein
MSRDYEADVIAYIMERYPIRKRWFKPDLKQVTKEWTLQDDFQFVPEDAQDFLLDLFEKFNIEYSNFDGRNYFEYEYPFWQKRLSPEPEIRPLSVNMIIESAKAGKWLYD